MPITQPQATVASAAGGLLGSTVSAISSAIQNKKNRRWSEEMYQREKTDNLAFWNQQNEYNSPAAQMKRFQEAGLNPNRIYGAGTPGNAEPIKTAETPRPQTETPDWGAGLSAAVNGGLAAYYNAETQKLTNANLEVQNTNLQREGYLKEALTNESLVRASRGRFDLGFEERMQEISADARRLSVQRQALDYDLAMRKDWRETIMQSQNIIESSERIASMESQRANNAAQREQIFENIRQMKKEGYLKDFELRLNKINLTKSDPYYMRVTSRVLEPVLTGAVPATKSWFDNAWDNLKKMWNDTPQSTHPNGTNFSLEHPNKN